MKPPNDARPLSDLRVTRKTNLKVDGGDGHSWAVSYADLLMVLLSFFVIFFSLSEENPDTAHEQLRVIAGAMGGKPLASSKNQASGAQPQGMAEITEALKIEGVKVSFKEGALLIDLENGVFPSGHWQADAPLQSMIEKVVKQIAPHKDKIMITIIGHADQKVMRRRNEYLTDNFDLSSLRALNVLKFVISKGIPATHASARAASSNDRDARSVTFEVRIKSKSASPVAEAS